MNISKFGSSVVIAGFLTACGGTNDVAMEQLQAFPGTAQVSADNVRSGNGTLVFSAPDGKNAQISDLAYLAADLVAVEAGAPEFDFSRPASATATYDGLVGLTLQHFDELLLGNATLTADFGASSLTGSASGFTALQETYDSRTIFRNAQGGTASQDTLSGYREIEQLSGTLPISSGTIGTQSVRLDLFSGSTNVTTFDAQMNGTLTGGFGDYEVSTDLQGAFAKVNDQNIVLGEATGQITDTHGFSQSAEGVLIGAERE